MCACVLGFIQLVGVQCCFFIFSLPFNLSASLFRIIFHWGKWRMLSIFFLINFVNLFSCLMDWKMILFLLWWNFFFKFYRIIILPRHLCVLFKLVIHKRKENYAKKCWWRKKKKAKVDLMIGMRFASRFHPVFPLIIFDDISFTITRRIIINSRRLLPVLQLAGLNV